jgi:hypothetical protein
MYIYINERTLNRSRELKKRLRYTQGVEVDEEKLCEMENRLLQEEIAMYNQAKFFERGYPHSFFATININHPFV